MQNLLSQLFLGAALSLLTCNKKNNQVVESNPAQLVGTWELRQAQNGMMPTTQHAPGNGNRFHFTETAYEQYQNNNLVKSGSYKVVRDTTVGAEVGLELPTGQFTNRLILSNDSSAAKLFFEIEGTKLTLLTGFFPTDGGSRQVYEKTKGGQ